MLENPRAISLTLCIGKLVEQVVMDRLTTYMVDGNLFPPTMSGFRPDLPTQYIILQFKQQIIYPTVQIFPKCSSILGIDLAKAFGSVSHSAILDNLNHLEVDAQTFNYIEDFLVGWTAIL